MRDLSTTPPTQEFLRSLLATYLEGSGIKLDSYPHAAGLLQQLHEATRQAFLETLGSLIYGGKDNEARRLIGLVLPLLAKATFQLVGGNVYRITCIAPGSSEEQSFVVRLPHDDRTVQSPHSQCDCQTLPGACPHGYAANIWRRSLAIRLKETTS